MRLGYRLVLSALLAVALVAPASYGADRTATSQLALVVPEQQSLTRQADNFVLKIRLAPGVTAKLWGDKTCGSPDSQALSFTQSGTYTIPLRSILAGGAKYVCLASSDGVLRAALPLPEALPQTY